MTAPIAGKNRFAVLKIVGIYALLGIVLVCFSDSMLGGFVNDPAFFKYLAFLKDILFILFTAALFFFLINRQMQRAALSESQATVQDALLRSEALLAKAQKVAKVGSWELDLATDSGSWSAEMFHLTGFDPSRGVPHLSDFYLFVHPEDRHALEQFQKSALQIQASFSLEFRSNPERGPLCYFITRAEPVVNDDGSITRMVGTLQDITDLKQAQEALRESEAAYRTIFDQNPHPVSLRKMSGEYMDVNDKFMKSAGLPRSEILGKTALELGMVDQATHDAILHEFQLRGGNLDQFEARLWSQGAGSRCDALISSKIIQVHGEPLVLSITNNITERKQAEQALQEFARRQQALLAAIPDIIMEVDLKKTYVWANQPGLEFFGDDVIGRQADFYFEDDQKTCEKVEAIFSGAETTLYVESLQRRRDGQKRLLAWWCRVLKDAQGTVTGAISSARDITESRRAEEERSKLITAVEQAQEVIVITDKDGFIQYVNDSFVRILGLSKNEALGMNQAAFAKTQDAFQIHQKAWESIAEGNVWSGRIHARNKNGAEISLEAFISPIRNEQGTITSCVNIARDITKELMMEEQLRQSQKMEALGTLAGGIAHDFNNILAAIMGYTELAESDALEGSEIKYNLGQVLKAADRARALVKQILAFSRKTDQVRYPLRLQSIIKEALKLLRATIPTTIDVVSTINDDSGSVIADPTQMHQVLINLCMNAAHAMQEAGGTLEVGLAPAELNESDMAVFSDLHPGRYVKLTVSDTGTGIDPAIADRIFDPFFTTKQVGKGTGMGLSVVHGIIKSHGGAITVDSRPGAGTVVTVLLPRAEEKNHEMHAPAEPLPTGTECILFADDEGPLVQLGYTMLSSLGYQVVPAQGSLEALALFQKEPSRFDLVITDQTMPNMTGIELARQLLEIRPDIPIILCTGFSETVDAARTKELNLQAFVMKPVKLGEIAETIRKVFAGAAQAKKIPAAQ